MQMKHNIHELYACDQPIFINPILEAHPLGAVPYSHDDYCH